MIFSVFQKKNEKRRRLSSVIIVRNVTRYLKMMTKKHLFNSVAWKLFERQLFLILAQLGWGGFRKTRPGVQGMFGSWKLELKWKYFLKKKKKCNVAIRIEYRISCIAIRIVSQSYCIVATLLMFFLRSNSRMSGQGNVLEKWQ